MLRRADLKAASTSCLIVAAFHDILLGLEAEVIANDSISDILTRRRFPDFEEFTVAANLISYTVYTSSVLYSLTLK